MAYGISLPAKRYLQSPDVRFGGLSAGGGWVALLLAIVIASASGKPQIVTYRPVEGKGTSGGKFVIPCE